MEIFVNGAPRPLPDDLADPALPLLWALRDLLGLTGTKFGCGVAACGACTVHVDGEAVPSCAVPIGTLKGRRVVTIEALGSADAPHPLQRAWVAHQVPQCGYCQSGILMAAAALLFGIGPAVITARGKNTLALRASRTISERGSWLRQGRVMA